MKVSSNLLNFFIAKNMKEVYKPTEEEIKKAENKLTKKEKMMSELRESYTKTNSNWKDSPEDTGLLMELKSGKYDLKLSGDVDKQPEISEIDPESGEYFLRFHDVKAVGLFYGEGGADFRDKDNADRNFYIDGKVGKHQIYIHLNTGHRGGNFNIEGTIDGEKINSLLAAYLFDRYFKIANLQSNDVLEANAEIRMRRHDPRFMKREAKEKMEKRKTEKEEELRKEKEREEREKIFMEEFHSQSKKFEDLF